MTSSSSCPLVSPENPANLINALSKNVEPYDPFAEHFGMRNTDGETILYEGIAEIVKIAIFAYANSDESCELIGPGKIAIIFYPNIGEIRVILQATSHLWPVRNERIEENQIFDYDGWLWRDNDRDRMCKKREDLGPSEKEKGFVFGDWNYYGVAFGTEGEVLKLKNVIRSIQARMSNDRIPRGGGLRDSFSLRTSHFWCNTGLRASNLKAVCIRVGSVWRINETYSVEHDRNGTVALVSKKDNPGILDMLVIFRTRNGEEIEDVRKCYRVPPSLKFVESHITPENKKEMVWEWAIGGDLWACAFRSSEEVDSLKEIIEFYVSDLKKSSKKFF